jgi:hypothetical protein
VAGARRNDGQRRDVQAELARLGDLAEAGAQAEEGVATDAGGQVGDRELDVVDLYEGGLCVSVVWGLLAGGDGVRTREWLRRKT